MFILHILLSSGVLKHSKHLTILISGLCFFSSIGNSSGINLGREGRKRGGEGIVDIPLADATLTVNWGGGGEGGGGEKEGGWGESRRRLDVRKVGDMSGLFNAVSSGNDNRYNTGNNIISNGDRVEVAQGTYHCDESASNCASIIYSMLYSKNIYGSIECTNVYGNCVLDGQSSRRVIYVVGGTLSLRALTFLNGQSSWGGGVRIEEGAVVEIYFCVFRNCRASSSVTGGGAIRLKGSGVNVNIYCTQFTGNTAASGHGNDIYMNGGTITIHNNCPSPYDATTTTQGKMTMRILQAFFDNHQPLHFVSFSLSLAKLWTLTCHQHVAQS